MGRAAKTFALIGSLALAGVGLALYGQVVGARPESNTTNLLDEPRHPVTGPMLRDAKAQIGQTAPAFSLPDPEGRTVALQGLTKIGPVVLVFTKDGCPCSIESQPFFNRLAEGYSGKVAFLGIIDGPAHVASKYRDDFKVPYPMLLAGDGAVYKAFRASRSVYTTLIGPEGKVLRQWPGYSKDMLKDLNFELARYTGIKPIDIDLSMAPEKPSSGCSFDEAG
ncbi:MAG: redoxin domain-containing protein [Armatimonadetes bacterium]|nr:redoxin domain-containing protein [Armatimonadota bacterium]